MERIAVDSPILSAAAPGEELARRDELAHRLKRLIVLRGVALAGAGAALGLGAGLGWRASPWPPLAVIAALALVNLAWGSLHRSCAERALRALTAEARLQLVADVAGLGLLLHYCGGPPHPCVHLFMLPAAAAAYLLDRKGACGIAALAAALVALLAWAGHVPGTAPFGQALAFGAELLGTAWLAGSFAGRARNRQAEARRLRATRDERAAALAEAERTQARALLEGQDVGVVVLDLRGNVRLANGAAREVTLKDLEGILQSMGARQDFATRLAGKMWTVSSAPSDAAACDEECVHDALERGGTLPPDILARLAAHPPAAEPDLLPPERPTRVEMERDGQRYEHNVSAVRTDGGGALGLLVVTRALAMRPSPVPLDLPAGTALENLVGCARLLLEAPRRTDYQFKEFATDERG